MIYPINHLPKTIHVGIQTESGVESIGFDLSPWLTRWPDMTVLVWPTRPGEEASYPAADTEMVGNVLYWYPNGTDTEKEGAGTVEVVGVGGGKRKSSGVIDTLVKKTSLDVTQETPEPIKPWAEKVLEAAKEVKSQVDVGTGTGLYIVNQRKDDKSKADRTAEEIKAAVSAGKTVLLRTVSGEMYSLCVNLGPNLYYTNVRPGLPGNLSGYGLTVKTAIMTEGDGIRFVTPSRGTLSPNPYKLKLTGAVEAEYDGSEEIVVKIPEAGSAPTEITILRETVLTRVEDDSSYLFVLPTPWENEMDEGNSYKVTYNGVAYNLKATKASDLRPDAGPGMLMLGNYSIIGGEGGDATVPFCLAAYPNADGAEMGGYAALISNDGAESVVLSITGQETVTPAKLPSITLTIDADGNVTSDTTFAQAWAMDNAHLQAAITVVRSGTMLGADATYQSPADVRRVFVGGAYKALQIAFVDYLDIGDVQQMRETTRYIYWRNAGDKQLYLANHTISSLPSMDGDNHTNTGTFYLRCVDGDWQAVGIDQLKADLGLTGGEVTTYDTFYTADGQVFTTVDDAVLHVQKGDE